MSGFEAAENRGAEAPASAPCISSWRRRIRQDVRDLVTDRPHGSDRGDGNQGDDQGVFHRHGAPVILHQSAENRQHASLHGPNLASYPPAGVT